MSAWPQTREELIEEQLRLGALDPPPWQFAPEARVGGVFVCFARGGSGPGSAGDPAWAAAAVGEETVVVPGKRAHRTSRVCSRCGKERCSRPRCARSSSRRTCSS